MTLPRSAVPACPVCDGLRCLSVDGERFVCDRCHGLGRARCRILEDGLPDHGAADLSRWQPTEHGPGSAGKVAVMMQRYARREPLFHALDAPDMNGAEPLTPELEAMRRRHSRRKPPPAVPAAGDLHVSIEWIAERLGRSWGAIWQLRYRHRGFPAPVSAPGQKPQLYSWNAVLAWLRQDGEPRAAA